MRKVRRQTDKLIEELLALRSNRKSIDDFNLSFLSNFCDSCKLVHSHISSEQETRELYKVAYKQYFVFLVSSWETFFRDMFVFVYTRDTESIDRLLEKMVVKENSVELQSISLVELLSKSFNFQNIDDLESAYNALWGDDFLKSICETTTDVCGFAGKVVSGFSVCSIFPDWHDIIDRIFSIRHKVVHDANYRPKIDAVFMQKAEAIFSLIPQLATYFVAKRYGMKHVVLTNAKGSVPYVFSVDDLLSDDWGVVD